jgi:hypothetical protein
VTPLGRALADIAAGALDAAPDLPVDLVLARRRRRRTALRGAAAGGALATAGVLLLSGAARADRQVTDTPAAGSAETTGTVAAP